MHAYFSFRLLIQTNMEIILPLHTIKKSHLPRAGRDVCVRSGSHDLCISQWSLRRKDATSIATPKKWKKYIKKCWFTSNFSSASFFRVPIHWNPSATSRVIQLRGVASAYILSLRFATAKKGNSMTLFRTLIEASSKKKRFLDLGQQKAMESSCTLLLYSEQIKSGLAW